MDPDPQHWRRPFLGNVGSLCEVGQRPRHVGQLVQVRGAVGHITCTTRRKGAIISSSGVDPDPDPNVP